MGLKPKKPIDTKSLCFVDLVDIVRKSRDRTKVNLAFNEIESRMQSKINQIAYKFRIPGLSQPDIYQESLFALRYKAIKDYDQTRGNDSGPYPFDKFAVLCIRRHLSTKLKASYQNKKRILNTSISIDQDRSDGSDEQLVLADILHSGDTTILESIEEVEYYKTLFTQLYRKLSQFEKDVFLLYVQKNSYEQIAEKINDKNNVSYGISNIKSVDNALSRIKGKAKAIFDKYGQY